MSRPARFACKYYTSLCHYFSSVAAIKHLDFVSYSFSCMFFLPLIFTTFVMLDEQNDGILDRVITSGMTYLEIASAHTVVQLTYICIQSVEILIIMYVFYDNPYNGSLTIGFSLLIVIGITGMIYGQQHKYFFFFYT